MEVFAVKKNDYKEHYVIGPDWFAVVVFSIALCGTYYLLNREKQPTLPWNRVSVLHVVLCAGFLLFSLRSYVLDNQGISVRIFSIPLKRLSWNQIGEVVLVRKRRNAALHAAEGIILVTPINCAPFRIGVDKVDRYAARHLFGVYAIDLYSGRQANQIAAAFEKYYGQVIDLAEHQ